MISAGDRARRIAGAGGRQQQPQTETRAARGAKSHIPKVRRLPVVVTKTLSPICAVASCDEIQPAAMHRDQHIGLERLDLADDLLEVIGRRRSEMEAADDGVNLLDARDFLGLLHRIDDADMAAGTDHDQTHIPDIEAGRMLVDVLVGNDLALHLRRQVVADIAAEPVLHAEFDPGLRQDAFAAAARDLAGGEGMARDHGRGFAQHRRNLLRRKLAAIERAEIGELALGRRRADAVTEIVLAAGVELEVGRQLVAEFVEEADAGRRNDRSARG